MPHPFKKGDIVKHDYYGDDDYDYGVLTYAGNDIRTYNPTDWSCFHSTRITFYKYKHTGRYKQGHDHVCPIYYDSADPKKELDDELAELLLGSVSIAMEDRYDFDKVDEFIDQFYEEKSRTDKTS